MFSNNPFNEYRATQKQVQEKKAIDEISKNKVGRYLKKAPASAAHGADMMARAAPGDKDKSNKGVNKLVNRHKGTSMGVDKLTGKAKVPATEGTQYVIPEEIPANERTAFHGAAAAAAKAGKKSFNFGGKTHPVTMKKDTANAIADQKEGAMDFSKGAYKNTAVKAKGTPRAGNNPFRGGRPTVKTEGIYKDMDTEKSEPSPRSDAKVKSDFKKRRKPGEKTEVEMNPKMDKGTKDNSMEQKESRIRTALKSILEGDRAKHYKGATKPETMDDKLSGKGAKDMMNQPINRDDTEEKGHQDASKANRVGPSAKPRSSGDNLKNGDKKIIPSATPVKDPKGAGSAEVKAESFDKMAGIKAAYAEMYAPKVEEEIEESYTHEFDYAEDGKNTAKSFVDKAKKAGMKAKIHTDRGPGGGHPVVHLGHKDTKVMHKFLKKHYDSDIEHDDLDAHKI